MKLAKRLALILLILAGCVGCDQTTKFAALAQLTYADAWSFFGDTLRLQLVRNHGAFLSLGDSLPEFWRHIVFNVGIGAALLGLFAYLLFSRTISTYVVVALTLCLAGGASNLADRLAYGGYVVDFLNLGIGSLRTGIFNVADVFIMAGVLMLLLQEFRQIGRAPASGPR